MTIDRIGGVRIEDCEQVSRQLSRVYEVENVDYKRLEVGSPGVDRPLRTEAEFRRFAGERIEIKLREAMDGRKVSPARWSCPRMTPSRKPARCKRPCSVSNLRQRRTKCRC